MLLGMRYQEVKLSDVRGMPALTRYRKDLVIVDSGLVLTSISSARFGSSGFVARHPLGRDLVVPRRGFMGSTGLHALSSLT
jgi:hypothetical protein